MRNAMIGGLLGLLVAPGACITTCPLIENPAGLHVAIDHASQPPGAYRIELQAGAAVAGIQYELSSDTATCADPVAGCQPVVVGDTLFDIVPVSGPTRGLSATVRNSSGLGPAQLTMRIYRFESLVFEQTLTPQYTTRDPDGGPNCGDEYVVASETVVVP